MVSGEQQQQYIRKASRTCLSAIRHGGWWLMMKEAVETMGAKGLLSTPIQ